MAKFSFHCQCYKAGQLGGIDKHNRRLNKNYISNPDINWERSKENRIYIAPKQSLYQDCKDIINKKVIANGGRVTKASNWICECIFSYPEELPIERLDEYNDLVIRYMGARLGSDNIVMACCHVQDEAGVPHLHLDIIPIDNGKLSSKTLITRDFITSIHRLMPMILRNHGFNVESYEETETRRTGGLSAKEYKNKMEEESRELNKKLDEMVKEYNNLADKYNKLIEDKEALERKNRDKAYEVINQQERNR